MRGLLEALCRKALFALDPETAHGFSIRALGSGMVPGCRNDADVRLSVDLAGMSFPNPLGMAAGYDKNGEVARNLAGLGFGFVEIGTVTPNPQTGNPKPRIFRLTEDHAIINRLGFNNNGHATALSNLASQRREGIVGINIGANKQTEDRIGDYVAGISRFADIADYFTVNVSSPNTPGLRNLQSRQALCELLGRVLAERDAQTTRKPVFLKIAPDLGEPDLDEIAAECLTQKLDGLVVSNTTLSRRGLRDIAQAGEAGGVSGQPLFERSTIVLAKMRQRLGSEMPLIGVGGIDSATTAAEKIRAGADLVQLYTGLVYGGPSLPGRILQGLAQLCDQQGLSRLSELRDEKTAHYASLPIPD